MRGKIILQFPPSAAPLLNPDRTVSKVWYDFLIGGYNRQGGPQDSIYALLALALLQTGGAVQAAAGLTAVQDAVRAIQLQQSAQSVTDYRVSQLTQQLASVQLFAATVLQQGPSLISGLTTDQITEGSTNLYFTQARARTSVSLTSATSDLTYSSATGVFTYTRPTEVATADAWHTARTFTYAGDVGGSGSVDGSANVTFNLTVNQAAKWTTARTLTLGADLTGNVTFDGSANFTLNATIAAGAVTVAKLSTGAPSWDASGNLTVTTLKIGGNQVVGARVAGYGTPSGGSRISSFNAATATAAQTAQLLAQVVTDLETHGLFGT